MNFKINSTELTSAGFLKIYKSEVTFDSFAAGKSITAKREMMERGDSVAVVLYEKDTNTILFTNQFRFPAAVKDASSGFENAGWLIELPAGGLAEGEEPREAAIREVEEEIGYHISDMNFISTFFVSPGGTSERINLFFTEVNSIDKKSAGGGLIDEKEDIQLVKISTREIRNAIQSGMLRDGKTLIGLQWAMLNYPDKFN